MSVELQDVASALLKRAQNQGFVVAREVREALAAAGLPEARWKEVLNLAGASLHYQHHRYYYVPAGTPRMRTYLQQIQRQHRQVRHAIRELVGAYKVMLQKPNRRQHQRIHFLQAVRVVTEDRHELGLLSRDISLTGIRLIGSSDLTGQKIRVSVPHPDGSRPPCDFVVRVLWSSEVGDGLFENGGLFLCVAAEAEPLKLVDRD